MPAITCAGQNRVAKVAKEIISKEYCSTENQYYYGLKFHALAFRRKRRIPFPESITCTPADDYNLTIFKQNWGNTIANRKRTQNIQMLIPVKAIKGQPEQEKQMNKVYNVLFSTAVFKVRQPIENSSIG